MKLLFSALKCAQCEWRRPGPSEAEIVCGKSGKSQYVMLTSEGCPLAPSLAKDVEAARRANTKPSVRAWEAKGRDLWAQIHGYGTGDAFDPLAAAAFVYGLAGEFLPSCGCLPHFAAHLSDHPLDVSNLTAFRRWAWALHNAVNVRLGKPLMKWEDAGDRWAWEPTSGV